MVLELGNPYSSLFSLLGIIRVTLAISALSSLPLKPLAPEVIARNSLSLGENHSKTMVLTGAHGCSFRALVSWIPFLLDLFYRGEDMWPGTDSARMEIM